MTLKLQEVPNFGMFFHVSANYSGILFILFMFEQIMMTLKITRQKETFKTNVRFSDALLVYKE